MIVLNILGYFGRNKQNSYAALTHYILLYNQKLSIYKCILTAVYSQPLKMLKASYKSVSVHSL